MSQTMYPTDFWEYDSVLLWSCGSEGPTTSSETRASEVDLRGWFPSELISGLRIRINVLLGSDLAYLSDIKRCLHLWSIHLNTSLDIPIFRFRISNVLQILSSDYDSDTDVVQILSSNSKHISWYSLIDNFALTILNLLLVHHELTKICLRTGMSSDFFSWIISVT